MNSPYPRQSPEETRRADRAARKDGCQTMILAILVIVLAMILLVLAIGALSTALSSPPPETPAPRPAL